MDAQLARNTAKMTARILFFVVFGAVFLIVGIVVWNTVKLGNIDSFASCAEKYPVIQTYPERCRTPDGRVFTKQY